MLGVTFAGYLHGKIRGINSILPYLWPLIIKTNFPKYWKVKENYETTNNVNSPNMTSNSHTHVGRARPARGPRSLLMQFAKNYLN